MVTICSTLEWNVVVVKWFSLIPLRRVSRCWIAAYFWNSKIPSPRERETDRACVYVCVLFGLSSILAVRWLLTGRKLLVSDRTLFNTVIVNLQTQNCLNIFFYSQPEINELVVNTWVNLVQLFIWKLID